MGGWFGYVSSIGACSVVVGLVLASTLALYAYARIQKKRGREPRVRVVSLPPRSDRPAA